MILLINACVRSNSRTRKLADALLSKLEGDVVEVGKYGFYDAFSPASGWTLPRYLAIDQCTIAPMIENYRTGLLWRLFMSCPEVQQGLAKLGMTSNP